MQQPVYRPASVWITQVLLVPPILNLSIGLAGLVFACFSSEQTQNSVSQPRIAAFIGGFLALVVIGLAFWGLQKRKRYGKWLAVSLLISGVVTSIAESRSVQLIYQSVSRWQPLPPPPYECWESDGIFTNIQRSCGYTNYPELWLRILTDLLPALILGLLVVRLLYSQAAKRFFASHRT